MVLKVLGFVGLNFLLAFLIVSVLFLGLFIKMTFTNKIIRILINIILIFVDLFMMYVSYKWFGFYSLLLPIFMFIFSFFCFWCYKDEESKIDKTKSYYDN